MAHSNVVADVAEDRLGAGRRLWIDALLVAGGGACVAAGWPAAGVPLVVTGLVLPGVRRLGARAGARDGRLHRLVPPELASAHRAVVAAARLPGVDAAGVVEAADDLLLESAALLAGRPPRGAAQRRFVAARVRVMEETAAALEERHGAWTAARAEVDGLATPGLGDATEAAAPPEVVEARSRPGLLVGVLVVLLMPAFVAWDLVRGTGRAAVALADGVALRLRTAGVLAVRGICAAGRGVLRAGAAWWALRRHLVVAAGEARHRVVAARLRVQLHLRRARRGLRGLRLP